MITRMTPTTKPGFGVDSPAVRARDVSLAFGSRTALEGLDLELYEGQTLAVIGPNGSGKSTFLHALAGLKSPSSGLLEVRASERPGGVALVLQSTEIDRSLSLSVGEAVRMARYPHLGLLRRPGPSDRAAVRDALARVDMSNHVHRSMHDLSGGQRQRVLVAQGLAQGAELLLLDEPFTGLDVVSRSTLLEVIDAERDSGRNVVFSTHDLGEAQRADLVLLLATRQVAVGPPGEVLSRDNLSAAFGGRLFDLADGTVLVDDPHHHDNHDDHDDRR